MMKYGMLIQWSDEDQLYLVSYPDFHQGPMTHGKTYEEAAKNGAEVLKTMVEHYQEHGLLLPTPSPVADFETEPAPR